MKNLKFLFAVLAVAFLFASCHKDEKDPVNPVVYTIKTLTFENSDYKGSEGANYWSGRIDNMEYGGDLLYNDGDPLYGWYDEGNTELYSYLTDAFGDGNFWGGGVAVSNYKETNLPAATYLRQLSSPVASAGHASPNFAMFYGYSDAQKTAEMPFIAFKDQVARVIDHMYVVPSAYLLNTLVNGDGWLLPYGVDGTFNVWIAAYGYREGKYCGHATIKFIVKKGSEEILIKDWTEWDLSILGKVDKVTFQVYGDGKTVGTWGLGIPAYFCADDIAVRFEEK